MEKELLKINGRGRKAKRAPFSVLKDAYVGRPIKECCEILGVSPTTVYAWIRYYNAHPEKADIID